LQAMVTEATADIGGSTSSQLDALTTASLSTPSSEMASTFQTTVEIAPMTTELQATATGPVSSIPSDYTKAEDSSTVK